MGLYVDRCQAQQDVEGQQYVEQAAVAAVPCKQHQHGAYAHMAAREGCRGPFAGCLGVFNKVIEYAVLVSGTGQTVLIIVEIVVNVGEHAVGYIGQSGSLVVECRACYGHENEHHIIDEEGREHHERGTLELVVAEGEVIEHHERYHRIVGGVAHVHKLAHHGPRHGLAEQQGRLAAEHVLLPLGKHVVEVGQHAVDLVGVGIPPAQQRHLHHHACQSCKPARQHAVDAPQCHRDDGNAYAPPYHGVGVGRLGVCEEYYEQCEHEVCQHHPFEGKQPFLGLLLYCEKLLDEFYHFKRLLVMEEGMGENGEDERDGANGTNRTYGSHAPH